MKIVSIVGARPQFIKAAAVSRKLRETHQEVLVHTGQHYDYEMSGVFFDGLELPRPDVSLEVGSGTHGAQTGGMLKAIEEVLLAERPDCVLVYGDTNSTLAGALAASKLSIRLAHVEAGLRSYNRKMPEEINRVVTDHVSNLLLCPSDTAVQNLAAEGITKNVHQVGDVMLDVLNWAKERADVKGKKVLEQFGVKKQGYLLATIHRSENTDDLERLREILKAFNAVDEPIIFPVHPRSRKMMNEMGFQPERNLKLTEPIGYVDMVALTGSARCVMTDSGGLQKETFWLGVPCLTIRNETEWVETVTSGWNVLVGKKLNHLADLVKRIAPPSDRPSLYGDGAAAAKCVQLL